MVYKNVFLLLESFNQKIIVWQEESSAVKTNLKVLCCEDRLLFVSICFKDF